MQLTRHTDYALRVLIYLALQSDRLVTINEIAEAYNVPKNPLLKVVHQLAKEGLVDSARGRNGGLRLARPADRIRVGNVVNRVEKQLDIVNCDAPRCVLSHGCVLKTALDRARDGFLQILDEYTIADLVARPNTILKRLEIQ